MDIIGQAVIHPFCGNVITGSANIQTDEILVFSFSRLIDLPRRILRSFEPAAANIVTMEVIEEIVDVIVTGRKQLVEFVVL